MIVHLIHHLLTLFFHNTYDRHLLLAWYRSQIPGMPRRWYPGYVQYLIHTYPHAMRECVRLLNHDLSATSLRNTCP